MWTACVGRLYSMPFLVRGRCCVNRPDGLSLRPPIRSRNGGLIPCLALMWATRREASTSTSCRFDESDGDASFVPGRSRGRPREGRPAQDLLGPRFLRTMVVASHTERRPRRAWTPMAAIKHSVP